jgi:hypothetical protein
VSNIGDSAQTLSDSSQKVRDATGREFSSDIAAAIYVKDNKVFFEEINPGNTVKGTLVFDMPKGHRAGQHRVARLALLRRRHRPAALSGRMPCDGRRVVRGRGAHHDTSNFAKQAHQFRTTRASHNPPPRPTRLSSCRRRSASRPTGGPLRHRNPSRRSAARSTSSATR